MNTMLHTPSQADISTRYPARPLCSRIVTLVGKLNKSMTEKNRRELAKKGDHTNEYPFDFFPVFFSCTQGHCRFNSE